ncbi:T6SS effector BTH_I2691 family protein [Nissabacter sp. SGAir0207]|uniref:T6SS effector BTH_I2691 family protein n=1 Tax=Nissabacter sp. SGAir0207 TaxID=2126321 RepID=UPI0010CD38DC|nr:T6SS effector BTH_I2691 family protein [Nissabacter sp. SGAir0207]QCR38496.1 hypothetical protein C1N62_20410 [Nissabacter sp. SGAir0207]
MNIQQHVAHYLPLAQQAAALPSGCKACQRSGLPILPLRVAAVPARMVSRAWQPTVPPQPVTLTGGEFKYALRTLREGYLYVLLDQGIWQAYEVTAEGYLRQFNPFTMPESDTVEPLSRACLTYGHDILASFINIDDSQYSEAWIAFSSDPWSQQVLEEYASGVRPSARFTKINLSTLKRSPSLIPEARVLDSSLSLLKAQVAEFATDEWLDPVPVLNDPSGSHEQNSPLPPPGGMHGFYPRLSRAQALAEHVAQMTLQHGCAITALALNDPVGVVEELNEDRLRVVEARQQWNEAPEIRHQHLISEAIAQTLARIKQETTARSQPRYERPASGYPAAQVTVVPAEQIAQESYAAELARLQTCYDEVARATFDQKYQQTLARYQRRLTATGGSLSAWYQAREWEAIIIHDYAPETSLTGWVAQLGTLMACVQGSCTDPHTEEAWRIWFETPDSAGFRGLLGNQHSMLEAVYNGIQGYSNLKVLLGSDELGNLLKSKRVQKALMQRALALSGAYSRLTTKLSQTAKEAYTRVMQGMAYLLTGQQVTLFTLTMSIREFQQLYIDMAASVLPAASTPIPFGGAVQQGTTITRTVTTGGLLRVTDQEVLARRIQVTLVSDMAPDKLHTALHQAGTSLEAVSSSPLTEAGQLRHFSELRISALSLADGVDQGTLTLSQSQTTSLLRSQAQMMRRIVSGNSVGMGLSSWMLLLQIGALEANHQALEQAIGNDSKARLALLSNVTMVVSAAVEGAGFLRTLAMAKPWVNKTHWLIRLGGALGGLSAIIDGVGMLIQGWDKFQNKNIKSGIWYFGSGLIMGSGGITAIIASYAANFALLGPAGLAGLLILTGAALAIQAENAISTPFEIWLRRCCFGKPRSKDAPWRLSTIPTLNDANLNAALQAYNAINNGLTAEVGYSDKLVELLDRQDLIKMRIVLPGCDKDHSAWSYSLTLPNATGGTEILLATTHNTPRSTNARLEPLVPSPWQPRRRRPDLGTVTERWQGNDLVIEGEAWADSTFYPQAVLGVSYWPDAANQAWVMGLQVKAED